jgi:uncharacterized protein (TIRG00374 family)
MIERGIMMTDKKSYLINTLIIITIGGLSLYFSVGKEIKNVAKSVLKAKPLWLLWLAFIMLLYYIMDGLLTKLFAKRYKKDYSLRQGVVNGLIGTLFSDLTPSSSGGQFAQVYLFNHQGIPPTSASGILLMCFISYQIVMVLFTAVIMLLQLSYFMHEGLDVTMMALVGFAINFIVTAALILGALSKSFQNFLIKHVIFFLAKIRIVKNYDATRFKIEDYFTSFRAELKKLFQHKNLLFKACLINTIKLTIMYSTPFFACKALSINVHASQFLNFLALASIINLINTFLPIPGASGGSEGCYIILFNFLGHVNTTSSMMLWRFFSFYFGLILSFIVFLTSKEMKQKRAPER